MSNTTLTKSIALSVRQPWAWLIIRPDITDPKERNRLGAEGVMKYFENRLWRSHYRGPVLIHAAKGCTWQEYCHCQNFLIEQDIPIQLPEFESLERGGFIGRVKMVDCVEYSESPWFTGPFGFHFLNPEIIPFTPFSATTKFFHASI